MKLMISERPWLLSNGLETEKQQPGTQRASRADKSSSLLPEVQGRQKVHLYTLRRDEPVQMLHTLRKSIFPGHVCRPDGIVKYS